MSERNSSASNQVLVVLLLIITFPIWFAAGAAVLGIMAGLAGAVVGIFGALFGVLAAIIFLPFKLLFGGVHGWHWFPHLHFNGYVLFAVIIIVALMVKRRRDS